MSIGGEGTGQRGIEEHLRGWFPRAHADFRSASLNRLVAAQLPPGTILDLGCGSGTLSAFLLERGHDVVSQDVSEAMVALAREHLERRGLPTAGLRRAGVEAIPETRHFDALVALDVIEHIQDDVAAVAAMREALRPGGKLVLTVPALPQLYGPKDVAVGHFRRYGHAGLREVITRAGFTVDSCRWWNLLGVGPVFLSNLRGRRLDESVRYGDGLGKRLVNGLLRAWFLQVENRVRPPIGLTLLVTAHRS